MSDERHTRIDVKDGVAEITLDRPERMNAYTAQMGVELNEHLVSCDRDDSVRAVIVTGAGRAFCAGADLDRGGDTFATGDQRTERPRVARIEGGAHVAIASDHRHALRSSGAEKGNAEIRHRDMLSARWLKSRESLS